MLNFTYHNPVKIVFGKNTIGELRNLIPINKKVLITYGGGSIKKNGVYDQVKDALSGHTCIEFSGIEPNPVYETLILAVELAKKENIDFLLAVGGGSVLDGTKFIAAAINFQDGDPWDMVEGNAPLKEAVPLGCVLTLSATGSEMNGYAVISRLSTQEKRAFGGPHLYPRFSILDPQTTFTLSQRQIRNGIVDPFVHVTEQYLTYDVNAPLQSRQAEAVLLTLIEEGPKALADPHDYNTRANLMWCATHALNGIIGCGVPQDWASHIIGHELTAMFGLDHAQALAVVLPGVLKHQRQPKSQKLVQYADRVWNIKGGTDEQVIDKAIERTIEFFRSIGMATTLTQYKIKSDCFETIARRISERGILLGEHADIGEKDISEILQLCL